MGNMEKEASQKISDAINHFGNLKEMAEILANDHPTLQQSFMRLALHFIEMEATKEYIGDLRNKATIQLSKEMWEQFKDKAFLPYI